MARHQDPAASLERKLGEFASSLPSEERGLFLGILAIAATADDADVQGFALGVQPVNPNLPSEPSQAGIPPFMSLDASAAIVRNMMKKMSDTSGGITGNLK